MIASELVPKRVQLALQRKKQTLGLPATYTHRQVENYLHQRAAGRYLGDTIFGASDGLVTTFAVVAGAAGAELSATIIIIVGVANLLGDGLSMGLGNYLGKRSEGEYEKKQLQKELWEIEHFPEIEEFEMRKILLSWGMKGKTLDGAVTALRSDPKLWAGFMLKEKIGIYKDEDYHPAKHGLATFFSFALAGFVPLLPFLFGNAGSGAFLASIVLTGLTMFFTGAYRSQISSTTALRGGAEMLLVGTIASGAAYLIGVLLGRLFG